jgi:hypothetical protein
MYVQVCHIIQNNIKYSTLSSSGLHAEFLFIFYYLFIYYVNHIRKLLPKMDIMALYIRKEGRAKRSLNALD